MFHFIMCHLGKMKRKTTCLLMAVILLVALIPYVPIAHAGKMAEDLQNQYQDDDIVEAMVFIGDVSYEEVMETFAERYPEEKALYVLVKESEEIEELSAQEGELLQDAIGHKRDVFAEFYENQNGAFWNTYKDRAESIFQSRYSPMLIVRTTYSVLKEMEADERCEWITGFYGGEIVGEDLSSANVFTRADYVRDTCGNSGAGVKIGMIDEALPDLYDTFFSQATIYNRIVSPTPSVTPAMANVKHATNVARILVGISPSLPDSKGFAPSAELYCCATIAQVPDFYSDVEWLLDQDVNVINMSIRILNAAGTYGTYDVSSRWVDHIAVMHDVHFVKSSGNEEDSNPNGYVTSPGMAYNVMTVGAFNQSGATAWNQYGQFQMGDFSLYLESATNRAEKPNIVATGVGFWPTGESSSSSSKGTSYAAPQVTGTIAQLCSLNPALKTKQSSMGAILMASAAHKVGSESDNGGSVGDSFVSSVRVNNNRQISNKEGAGMLDSRWARDVVVSNKYWNATVYDSGFPYNKTVSITANESAVVRVCLFWLRQNSVSGSGHTGTVTTGSMSNLNLRILNPTGSIAAESKTTQGNFEIVQFTPHMTGTYTIQVLDLGGRTGKDYIGLAMWSGSLGD